MFKRFFTESKSDKVYFEGKTLWSAYGQGSGMTSWLPDTTKFLTDASGKNYDSIVSRLFKYSQNNKPLKAKSNVKMFEIPVYSESQYAKFGNSLDIWGGTQKPQGKKYMIITEEKNVIVNFFDKKNEALAWMRSIA